MLAEVKKCAENNNIRGLRYIFADSLDVDPTFEKYKEDYDYCKKINGFFEPFVEITPLISDKGRWNMNYWDQLKIDLMKNFSSKRFEHMIDVAKVVYSDKVSRLVSERQAEAELEQRNKKIEEEKVRPRERIDTSQEVTHSTISQSDVQKRETSMKQQQLEQRNKEIEEQQRQQRERIEARRKESIASQAGNRTNDDSSKKIMGVALVVLIIAIVVVVLMVAKVL